MRYTTYMNMFKPTQAATPKDYINLIQDPKRKEQIIKLDALIRQTLPDFKPFILAGMIGYGKYHYKYASGREGDWAVIALASQKNYISVYVCASDGHEYVAERYKDKLPKASIGKSCIRFKKLEDIDLNMLTTVILEGANMMKKDLIKE